MASGGKDQPIGRAAAGGGKCGGSTIDNVKKNNAVKRMMLMMPARFSYSNVLVCLCVVALVRFALLHDWLMRDGGRPARQAKPAKSDFLAPEVAVTRSKKPSQRFEISKIEQPIAANPFPLLLGTSQLVAS